MQLLYTLALCALLVAGIRCESEPALSSSLYKDGHQDYVHQFHHGQPHGSEVVASGGGGIPQLVQNPQIQDQSVVQDQVSHSSVSHVGHGSQGGHVPVGHVGQVQSAVGPVGHVGHVGPVAPVAPVAPLPGHIGQLVQVPYKSDVPVHAAARAIGTPVPVPYYPYFGRTYASPVYSQYQPYQQYQPVPAVPHQGVYQHQVYPSAVSPYAAVPYSAVPVPTSVYPGYSGYNYPYYPQYVSGVAPYYNQQSGEVQSVTKQ